MFFPTISAFDANFENPLGDPECILLRGSQLKNELIWRVRERVVPKRWVEREPKESGGRKSKGYTEVPELQDVQEPNR